MIGMDVTILDILYRIWMFRDRSLVLGFLTSFFMGLRSFILDSNLDSFAKSLTRSASFAGSNQIMADIEKDLTISSFSISNQGNVLSIIDELGYSFESFFEKLSIFSSALHIPDEPANSVHEDDSPSRRLIGRNILVHLYG